MVFLFAIEARAQQSVVPVPDQDTLMLKPEEAKGLADLIYNLSKAEKVRLIVISDNNSVPRRFGATLSYQLLDIRGAIIDQVHLVKYENGHRVLSRIKNGNYIPCELSQPVHFEYFDKFYDKELTRLPLSR